MQRRRDFLAQATLTGMAGLLGVRPASVAAEPPPETTRLRVLRGLALCEAPVQVAESLLRGEGLSDVQYVAVDTAAAVYRKLASGEIDLG